MHSTRPGWRLAIPVALLIGLAVMTHQRLAVWQSDLTLWKDAAEKSPMKPRPVMDYGRALEMVGDFEGARQKFQETIPLAFDWRRGERNNRFAVAAAETNIAHIYLRTGHDAEALKILKGTLDWWPEFPYAHYNIGRMLWERGQCDDAQQEMAYARAQDPSLSQPDTPCGHP